MTSILPMLLVKSTVVLFAASVLVQCLKSRPAAVRHLVWISAFCILLVLPCGVLLPDGTVPAALWITAGPVPASAAAAGAWSFRWPLLTTAGRRCSVAALSR